MRKFLNVKSLFAILLCFILIFSLCACKGTEQTASTNDDVSAPAANSSVYEVSSDDETSTDATTPSLDSPSSNESGNTTTQTPSQNTESSKVESTVTSSNPTTSSSTPSQTTQSKPKTAAELIVGKWRGSYDMVPLLKEMGYGTIEGTAIVSCDVEFTTNGIFYENIDRQSAETAYRKVFIQMLNESIVNEGMTKEEFEATLGATLEEYVDALVEAVMASLPQTIINAYKFEGDDLYVRTQDDTDFVKNGYKFNGENSVTLTDELGESISYTRIG